MVVIPLYGRSGIYLTVLFCLQISQFSCTEIYKYIVLLCANKASGIYALFAGSEICVLLSIRFGVLTSALMDTVLVPIVKASVSLLGVGIWAFSPGAWHETPTFLFL